MPIMGMEKLWKEESHPQQVTSYNTGDNPEQTRSASHGGFDYDTTTMNKALQYTIGIVLIVVGIAGLFLPLLQGVLLILLGVFILKADTSRGIWTAMKEKYRKLRTSHKKK